MITQRILLTLSLALFPLFVSSPAQAVAAYYSLNNGYTIFEPTGEKYHFDTMETSYGENTYEYDQARGTLGGMTQITFSYQVQKGNGWGPISMFGGFEGVDPLSNLFEVSYDPASSIKSNKEDNWVVGSIIMRNLSNAPAEIFTFLSANKDDLGVSSHYFTESISAVPVPAALPLFGAGLIGLAGLKRVRKKKDVA